MEGMVTLSIKELDRLRQKEKDYTNLVNNKVLVEYIGHVLTDNVAIVYSLKDWRTKQLKKYKEIIEDLKEENIKLKNKPKKFLFF